MLQVVFYDICCADGQRFPDEIYIMIWTLLHYPDTTKRISFILSDIFWTYHYVIRRWTNHSIERKYLDRKLLTYINQVSNTDQVVLQLNQTSNLLNGLYFANSLWSDRVDRNYWWKSHLTIFYLINLCSLTVNFFSIPFVLNIFIEYSSFFLLFVSLFELLSESSWTSLFLFIYSKNNHYMSIVHSSENDECDLHHARLCHIGEWSLLILLPDLWRGKVRKAKKNRVSLTTITTHSKVFCHLDSSGVWIDNKIPGQRQSFTVTTKDGFNCLILTHESCDPTWIVLMAIFQKFFGYLLWFIQDCRCSRMGSIMSSKFLVEIKSAGCLLFISKTITINLHRPARWLQSRWDRSSSLNLIVVIEVWYLMLFPDHLMMHKH